jgi:hypothetical protein
MADHELSTSVAGNVISARLKTGLSTDLSWHVHSACAQSPFHRTMVPKSPHYSAFSITGTWACRRPSSRLAGLWRSPLWEVGWTTARPWVNSLKICWKLPAQRMFNAVKLFVCGSSSKTLWENTRSLQALGQFLVSRNSLLSSPIDAFATSDAGSFVYRICTARWVFGSNDCEVQSVTGPKKKKKKNQTISWNFE